MITKKGSLFVVSAPTGGGKTTVANKVLQELRVDSFSISKITTYTTRPSRAQEINGVDYHFITEEEFIEKKEQNFFLECNFYDGYWYGSPHYPLKRLVLGESFIIITDRAGAREFKRLLPQYSVLIWLAVPNAMVVHDRLKMRGSENNDGLKRRCDIATKELAEEEMEHLFDYHVINDTIDITVRTVKEIILEHLLKEN